MSELKENETVDLGEDTKLKEDMDPNTDEMHGRDDRLKEFESGEGANSGPEDEMNPGEEVFNLGKEEGQIPRAEEESDMETGADSGNGMDPGNEPENFGDIIVREEALAEAAKEKKRFWKRKNRTPEEEALREEKHNSWMWGFLVGVVVCMLLAIEATHVEQLKQQSSYNSTNSSTTTSNDTLLTNGDEILEKLQTIQSMIDLYFLYDVDEETVVESLYAALLDSLGDPYSVYYTAEEYADLMESGSGTYYGIGVEVTQSTETGEITVTRVFENCPGAEAGMEVGDIITAVDGVSTADTDLSTVVTWIKGEEYTTVDITVDRDGEEITMTVERRQVDNETVTGEMLEDSIGYVAVDEFDSVTVSQFETELEELAAEGMQGLIIDLRGNPGGYLDVCVDMLDYLLPEGLLVYTEDKYGNREEYTSDADASLTDIPIVILIDGSSASASEVFTGAMQDYERATIVGTQSFGKGIVQSIFSLGDGSGMKITVSNYYTPNGNNIHGIGITPDVVVELDDTTEEDEQLEAAIEVLLEEMGD